ncbi:MAG: hypothetical protein ACI4QT_07480 [Kiritimatiellia bacterium]
MIASRETDSTEESKASWRERILRFYRALFGFVVQGIRNGSDIPFASQVILVLLALLFLGVVLWTGQTGTDSSHADSIGLESETSSAVLRP